jgi:hypothetical protein
MLSRITANNNRYGVDISGGGNATIANSVMSNNSHAGLQGDSTGGVWLAKSVITGNSFGVVGTVNSFGDNYIANNGIPVSGTLTFVGAM